jgi:hypothetical protein
MEFTNRNMSNASVGSRSSSSSLDSYPGGQHRKEISRSMASFPNQPNSHHHQHPPPPPAKMPHGVDKMSLDSSYHSGGSGASAQCAPTAAGRDRNSASSSSCTSSMSIESPITDSIYHSSANVHHHTKHIALNNAHHPLPCNNPSHHKPSKRPNALSPPQYLIPPPRSYADTELHHQPFLGVASVNNSSVYAQQTPSTSVPPHDPR